MPSNKAKFQKGEFVYYVGKASNRALDKNMPYEVIDCVPSTEKYYNITIMADNNKIVDNSNNFISAHDYKNLKKSNGNNFKGGDVVYYNGPDGQGFKNNQAYTLLYTLGGDFSIKVDNDSKEVSKEVVNAFFISEDEYKKSKGSSTNNSNQIIIQNSTNFKSKYYQGDIVYYVGIETDMLNNDQPYKVQAYDSNRDIIRINGVVMDAKEVISKKEYDHFKIDDEDDAETVEIIGKPKTEIEIKHQIWKDTKSGKLSWFRPFSSNENFYRAILLIDNPKNLSLKFDLYISKLDGNSKLVLFIYFKKNSDEILIKKYSETPVLKIISNYIKNNLTKNEI